MTLSEGADLLAYLHQYNRQWQSSLTLEWAASIDVPTRMRRTKEVADSKEAAAPNWIDCHNNRPLQALREAAASGERQILAMRTPTVMPDNASVKAQKPPARSACGGESGGTAATEGLRGAAGGPARTAIVLWEGADLTDRNIRLARTRTAYLEAHGDVTAAIEALKQAGSPVARSTFYNHLDALDVAIPRWRESVQLSNPTGNLDGMRNVGTRGKSRDRMR